MMLETKVAAAYVKKLVARALDGAESLPASERIELHEGAALALSKLDKRAADVAAHTAHLLRESERHQLKFRELLRS